MPAFPDIPQLVTSQAIPIKGEIKDYSANGKPNFRVFHTGKHRYVLNFYIDAVDWITIQTHFDADAENEFTFTDQRTDTIKTVRYDVGGDPRRGRGDDVRVGRFLASVRLIEV